jgi:hypothetical protein
MLFICNGLFTQIVVTGPLTPIIGRIWEQMMINEAVGPLLKKALMIAAVAEAGTGLACLMRSVVARAIVVRRGDDRHCCDIAACGRHRSGFIGARLLAHPAARNVDLQRTRHAVFSLRRVRWRVYRHSPVAGGCGAVVLTGLLARAYTKTTP